MSNISALPHKYGKYELLERIGVGGMAEVYRAHLPGVGGFRKNLVIKRLRPKHAHDRGLVQLFIEEAKLAAHVVHKNVVQVYELGELESGELYIAMEYVHGTDLRRLTEHALRADRPIPIWLAVHTIIEVLEALSYAHNCRDDEGRPRNLVHCDVTPENIFLSRSGDIKLGDFGVANDDTRVNPLLADQTKGKLPYMSPEQVLEQPIDCRSDVFSSAVVLWETLSGRRLFPGRTPSEVMAQICASPRPPPSRFVSEVPPELDTVLHKALKPELELRYQTAQELSSALKDIQSQLKPKLTTEEVKSSFLAIMDAPIIRPDAVLPETDEEDDGHDELEALDRRHEEPMSDLSLPPLSEPGENPASSPQTSQTTPHPKTSQSGRTPVRHLRTSQSGVTPVVHPRASQSGITPTAHPRASQSGITPAAHPRASQSGITPAAHPRASQSGITPAAHPRASQSGITGAHSRASQSGIIPAAHPRASQSGITPAAHPRASQSGVTPAAHPRASQSGVTPAAHPRASQSGVTPAAHPRASQSGVTPAAHPRASQSGVTPAAHPRASQSGVTPAAHPQASQSGVTPAAHWQASPSNPRSHNSPQTSQSSQTPTTRPKTSQSDPTKPSSARADAFGPARVVTYDTHGIAPTSSLPSLEPYDSDGPTYRIIRDRPRSNPDAEAIMQAYLAEDESSVRPQWSQPSVPSVLGGVSPLWAKSTEGKGIGPLKPQELLELLHRAERRGQPQLLITADNHRWMTPQELSVVLGLKLIAREAPAAPTAQQGLLSEHSFIEIVGILARSRWTGVLSAWAYQGRDRDRIELHLSEGDLVGLHWTAAPFETWRALFDDTQLGALGLPEAFSEGILSGTSIAQHLPRAAVHRVEAIRHTLARRRLETAVTWDQGGYAYSAQVKIETSARKQSLLKLLPGLTYCALSTQDIERRLTSRLERPHRLKPAYSKLSQDLGLTPQEAEMLSGLASSMPLGAAARNMQGKSDDKFVWVMAYLLTELGLLTPVE